MTIEWPNATHPSPSRWKSCASRQTQKTRRFLIVTAGIVVSLGIIAWAAVRMTEKPSWLVFALALLAAVSAPSGLLLFLVRFIWRWTRFHMGRTARLENDADPDRTTSTLNPDGTDPPGALP